MKTLSCFCVFLLSLTVIPTHLRAADYEITCEPKKNKVSPGRGSGTSSNTSQQSQSWTGEIKILNRTFQLSPALDARYIVFVKRQQLGAKTVQAGEHIDRVLGNSKVEPIKPSAFATFLTSEVKLKYSKLDAGYYFTNGGITESNDQVIGIWVKFFNNDVEVAEYVNPSTLKGKHKWE